LRHAAAEVAAGAAAVQPGAEAAADGVQQLGAQLAVQVPAQ